MLHYICYPKCLEMFKLSPYMKFNSIDAFYYTKRTCTCNDYWLLHGPWLLPDKANFTVCSIIKLATSLLMRHLVIGQRQKVSNFSAFHWSPHGCLITIGQHFVTTRVVHLPKRTETSLITESDQSRANHQLLQLCTVRTAWSDSDQAVEPCIAAKAGYTLHFDTLTGRSQTDNTSYLMVNLVE